MESIKYYIYKDYLNIGGFGSSNAKKINIALLSIGSVFFISLLFYIILFTSTNFWSLNKLGDYVKEYDEVDNAEFERINLAMKIMPSYNKEKNALYMEHSNDMRKTSIPYSQPIMENFNMNNTFFFVNRTVMFFPKFNFVRENIPVGDSVSMCISVSWAPKERGLNYDIMKFVSGFPGCKKAQSGKFIWNSEDPDHGVDVPVWTQKSFDVDCVDEQECNSYCNSYNALYFKGINSKKCYSYDVLETICIVVDYNSVLNEYKFAGGCFKDNATYLMSPAQMNQVYYFEGIEIEVRNRKDPVIKAGELSNYTFSFGENWNYFACFLNVLIFFALIGLVGLACYIWYIKKNEKPKPKALLDNAKPRSDNSSLPQDKNVA